MKLYTFDPAPNPKRLADFMTYKGIEIETTQIDMMGGEQLGEDYLKINPAGTVPALVLDDGTVLTEVIGMCVYLEALYPEKPLLGNTALEKALVTSWSHKLFAMIMMAVADALRNRSPNFANRALPGPLDVPQIEALVERGKLRLNYAWPEMEKALDGREWLASDSISLADIDLAACVGFAGWVKSAPGEEFPNILAHSARVQAALTQS
ncbi:MAG: glutathione S-transferase family protein [Halioglobus sp.]